MFCYVAVAARERLGMVHSETLTSVSRHNLGPVFAYISDTCLCCNLYVLGQINITRLV